MERVTRKLEKRSELRRTKDEKLERAKEIRKREATREHKERKEGRVACRDSYLNKNKNKKEVRKKKKSQKKRKKHERQKKQQERGIAGKEGRVARGDRYRKVEE